MASCQVCLCSHVSLSDGSLIYDSALQLRNSRMYLGPALSQTISTHLTRHLCPSRSFIAPEVVRLLSLPWSLLMLRQNY